MTEPAGDPRGILHVRAGSAAFSLGRRHPSAGLAPFVEYPWSVEWDRTGQPAHLQRMLPNPSVHLSFEPGLSRVTGLSRRRAAFEYRLTGAGRVVGVRFRPGGARPWLTGPVSVFTDREAPVAELVEVDDVALCAAVQTAPDAAAAAALVDTALVPLRPAPDPTVDRVADLVAAVQRDPAIRRAADLAVLAGSGVRSLQRLCAEWVGVGPTWLVRCARLHEAAGRAGRGRVDWAALAAELGYADQSHLARLRPGDRRAAGALRPRRGGHLRSGIRRRPGPGGVGSGQQPAGPGHTGGAGQPVAQAPVGGDHEQVVVAVGQLHGDGGQGVVATALGADQPDAGRRVDLPRPALDDRDEGDEGEWLAVRTGQFCTQQPGQALEEARRGSGAVAPPAVRPRADRVGDVDQQDGHGVSDGGTCRSPPCRRRPADPPRPARTVP